MKRKGKAEERKRKASHYREEEEGGGKETLPYLEHERRSAFQTHTGGHKKGGGTEASREREGKAAD